MTDTTLCPGKPSLWDRLIVPYPLLPLGDHASADGDRLRRDRRTAKFEGEVSLQKGSARAPADLADLVAEYKARLARWDRLRGSLIDDDDFCRARRSLSMSESVGAGAAILWYPIYLTYYALRRGFGLGTMARLDRALAERTCPDCEYNLAGITDGVRLGTDLLPRVCPECGASWPLLPPPVLTP